MAHGEMLMIGAYSCWLVQQVLAQLAPQWLAFYPLVALPVAFLVTPDRHGAGAHQHYVICMVGRWRRCSPGDQPDAYPAGAHAVWRAECRGGEPAQALPAVQVYQTWILPAWNRLAVLAFVLLVLCFTWLILNRTRLGMNVRAVTQNRAMAACCGVPTGRVDMLAFGLGSGIAGLGGVALSQLGNVSRAGSGLYHRLIPGGGPGRRRPAGRQRGGGLWAGHFQQNSRTANGRCAGQDPDPGDDYSVYSETPAGSVRAEREGD